MFAKLRNTWKVLALLDPRKCPNCDEITDGFPCQHCGYDGGLK